MRVFLMFMICIVSVTILSVSCKSSDQPEGAKFYYYPDKNVYYDVGKKSFLYSLNGGESWTTFTGQNNQEPEYLGEKIIIRSTAPEVFKDNEAHRKTHGGLLFDITSEDSSVASQSDEVTERKIVQKRRSAGNQTGGSKNKKGIGKFFNKLFGKSK